MGITLEPLSVITEFMSGGSLLSYLRNNESIELKTKYKIILGIARGMLHLHSENIIHRDLATRNVLLTSTQDPKISDFVNQKNSKKNSINSKFPFKIELGNVKNKFGR